MTFEDQVRDIVSLLSIHDEEDVTPSADLEHDLGMDSLDRIELSMQLEAKLGTAIPDDKADEWKTYGDVLRDAKEYRPKGKAAAQ